MNNPVQTAALLALFLLLCVLIAWTSRKCMKPPSAAKVAERQLYDAQRLALAHRAHAEEHAAMADMYERRMVRLRYYDTPPVTPPVVAPNPAPRMWP